MIEKNRFLSLYPRSVLRRCVFFGSHWNRKWLKSDVSCVCICIYALYTLCEIKTRKKAYMLQETLLSPRSGTEWGGAVWSLFVCYIHADCNRHSLTHSLTQDVNKYSYVEKKCLCECNKYYYNTAMPLFSQIRREIFSTLLSHEYCVQAYCVHWRGAHFNCRLVKKSISFNCSYIHSFAFWTDGHEITTSKLP